MKRVLITGASSGLGLHFAWRYAEEGHDLVLVARRRSELETLAHSIHGENHVRIHVMAVDLAEPMAIERMKLELDALGIEIGTLVNNAGFGANGAFTDMDTSQQLAMIDVNCRAPVELAATFLPAMIAAGEGGILNVASVAAFQSGPWMAIYYATKAFLLSFSDALHHEVRDKGVHVTALCPGPTKTGFSTVANMDAAAFDRFAANPGPVVDAGMTGLRNNQSVVVPGASNVVLSLLVRFMPRPLLRRVVGSLQMKRMRPGI